MFPKATTFLLNDFYGNPDRNGDGVADSTWVTENITRIVPPYPMFWSWNKEPVRTIALHKKCAKAFEESLTEVGRKYDAKQREILHLDQCGGGYTFRTMRGGERLSVHAYGAALDIAPAVNWLGRHWAEGLGMMPIKVVEIFAARGLRWGGKWQRPDAMHFEATTR